MTARKQCSGQTPQRTSLLAETPMKPHLEQRNRSVLTRSQLATLTRLWSVMGWWDSSREGVQHPMEGRSRCRKAGSTAEPKHQRSPTFLAAPDGSFCHNQRRERIDQGFFLLANTTARLLAAGNSCK